MAYIGQSPADKGTGLFSQDTFTGDGSTTTFDLTNAAPDGGGNELQVFVDNVRQQEGSSNAYTLGQDGSGDLKRITFTTAPAASQSIFVLNPGTKNVQQLSVVGDNTVTTAKIQDSAITAAKISAIPNDSVNATKIADDAISEEHLDNSVIIDNTELAEAANASDIFLVYDASAGTLKKILASNVGVLSVTVTSISPTNVNTGDGTGNHTFTITGKNFTGGSAEFVNSSGTIVPFDSVTVNSATQITGVIAKSSLPNSGEPYDIRVRGSQGTIAEKLNQVNINAQPVFVTASGSLGDVIVANAGSFSVNATDPESAGNVTFELQSGSLPPNFTITNTAAEGGTAIIGGTDNSTSSTTTFNFVLRAVDAASNTSSRAYSIRSRVPVSQSFTSSGTFSVPSGITQADVLVVAGGGGGGNAPDGDGPGGGGGGGGGAGGLVFMPNYPTTPGGTITVTVGAGSAAASPETARNGGADGQDSVFGSPGDPGLGQGGVLTAKRGGGGGAASASSSGAVGGSAGGGGGGQPTSAGYAGGVASQPTQPGNSGAYGFGNNGAAGNTNTNGGGGGGGGAGAAGIASMFVGGAGGAGKAYTIADGTTSVYYAGGGGAAGGAAGPSGQGAGGGGGQGGGGTGATYIYPYPGQGAQAGQANKGGGGGAGAQGSCSTSAGFSKSGGKGIVIVRY